MHRNSSLGAETMIISNAVKRSSGRIFDEARPGLRSTFMCKSVLIGLDPSTIGTHPRNKMDFAPRQSSHLTIVVERGVQVWRAGVLMGFHHSPRSELPIQEFSHRWHPKSGLNENSHECSCIGSMENAHARFFPLPISRRKGYRL